LYVGQLYVSLDDFKADGEPVELHQDRGERAMAPHQQITELLAAVTRTSCGS
jgi:hypothetical protein